MLRVHKLKDEKGGWAWQIGQVILARSYLDEREPGLFFFTISGVHRRGAEPFATHGRAEALLQRHLGCPVTFSTFPAAQPVAATRDARWHKHEPGLPAADESDSYSYRIGNVFIASLTNVKSIKVSGYHLHMPLAGSPPASTVLSISAGEQRLAEALGGPLQLLPGAVSYVVGANHLPAEPAWFSCRPTLFDGRPA